MTTSLNQQLTTLHSSIHDDFGGGAPLKKAIELMNFLIEQNLKQVVEIGVYRGRCLVALALAMRQTGGSVIGIDPYSAVNANETDLKHEKHLQRHCGGEAGLQSALVHWLQTTDFNQIYLDLLALLASSGLSSHARLIRQPSASAIDELRGLSIDLIHIDGNHDTAQVSEDIILYTPLVKVGGYLAMDDTDFISVQRALPLLKSRGCVMLKDHGNWQMWQKMQ